jgi:hypothetical protein
VEDLLTHNGKFDHMMVGLYEELMPPCETWKGALDYTYIGPCLPRTKVRLSPELDAFIDRGSKPIYIGFGSMRHANGDRLTRAEFLQKAQESQPALLVDRFIAVLGRIASGCIEQDGVVMGELGLFQPLGGGADLDGIEPVIEVELLGQHGTQCLVVVDQQNLLATIVYRHAAATCERPGTPYLVRRGGKSGSLRQKAAPC